MYTVYSIEIHLYALVHTIVIMSDQRWRYHVMGCHPYTCIKTAQFEKPLLLRNKYIRPELTGMAHSVTTGLGSYVICHRL